MEKTYQQLKEWDFELQPKAIAGKLYEKLFSNIFLNSKNSLTFEIKSELTHSYMQTGNIYVEIYQFRNNKWEKSGLSATTSDIWIHVLKGDNQEEMRAAIVLPTKRLKERLRYLYDKGYTKLVTKPKTDDGYETKGIIVDPRLLLFTDQEVEEFQEMKKQNILNKYKNKQKYE